MNGLDLIFSSTTKYYSLLSCSNNKLRYNIWNSSERQVIRYRYNPGHGNDSGRFKEILKMVQLQVWSKVNSRPGGGTPAERS